MGYKLADGSDSDLYRVGDTFIVCDVDDDHFQFTNGSIIEMTNNDGSCMPFFCGQFPVRYSRLKPTEETKRKVAERNQPKCKCGYVIPVMEIGPARSVDFGEPWEASADTLDSAHRYLFWLDCEKSSDKPEPLARIIDWRGGEEVKQNDVAIQLDSGGNISWAGPASHLYPIPDYIQVIRINTAVIPKQRTMTKAEVELEFGVKVVD